MFLRSTQNRTIGKEFVLDFSQENLTLLHQKYDNYFSTVNTEQSGWIRNSFSSNAEILTQESSLPVRKNILEQRNDRTLRFKFSDVPLDEFWCCIDEVAYMSEF